MKQLWLVILGKLTFLFEPKQTLPDIEQLNQAEVCRRVKAWTRILLGK